LEFGNLIARGIIDRAKVLRSALQGAASIAASSSPRKPWSPKCQDRRRRSFRATMTTRMDNRCGPLLDGMPIEFSHQANRPAFRSALGLGNQESERTF
jgi:hypothetical protein